MQRRHIRLQRVERRRTKLHEICRLRAARNRLEPQRTGAREEIENPRSLELRLQQREHGIAHRLGRGPHPLVGGRGEVTSGKSSLDDAQLGPRLFGDVGPVRCKLVYLRRPC